MALAVALMARFAAHGGIRLEQVGRIARRARRGPIRTRWRSDEELMYSSVLPSAEGLSSWAPLRPKRSVVRRCVGR